MKKIVYLLCLAAIVLASCGKSIDEQRQEQRAEKQRQQLLYQKAFKVGVMPTIDCLPIYLLKDSLLYDSTKLDLRLVGFTAHMDCDTAIVGSGSVQACITEPTRLKRLKPLARGRITVMTTTPMTWHLMASPKSKITALSGLADRMVAMTRHSATDKLTAEAERRGKLKNPLYEVQVNDVFVRLKMLLADEVDAAWLPDPQASQAKDAGCRELMASDKAGIKSGSIIFIDRKANRRFDSNIAEQRAEFRRAYDKALSLIKKNGEKHYQALIDKYMTQN